MELSGVSPRSRPIPVPFHPSFGFIGVIFWDDILEVFRRLFILILARASHGF
jgi:hypothetical protein